MRDQVLHTQRREVREDKNVMSALSRSERKYLPLLFAWTFIDLEKKLMELKKVGFNRESAKAFGIDLNSPTLIPPKGCSISVDGALYKPYCNGKPMTADSCSL